MATARQIDAAAAIERPATGWDYMHRDALLHLPAAERDAALRELELARRCVLRHAWDHADQILDALGLPPRTEAEKAAGPLPRPRPAHPTGPEPAPPRPVPPRRTPRRRGQIYRQCVGCGAVKREDEFTDRSYRCRDCARQDRITALERERVRDVDALAAEAFPAGSTQLITEGQDDA